MSNKRQSCPTVWIVSGPSGSGKTSLCRAILKDPFWSKRLMKSVSYTTRPLRAGEREGRDYHSISTKRFLELKRQDAFLENEKIFGFYYGTPKRTLCDAQKVGKDLLLCIDVKGARAVKKLFGKRAVSIFILAPQFEILNERLQKRSTENKNDIRKRLQRVRMEFSYMRDYDYIVINDDFRQAKETIKSIFTAKRCEGGYVLYSFGKAYR